MAKRPSPSIERKNILPGNFVSEWFGHRVFPAVSRSARALADQMQERCPFLSAATGDTQRCIKAEGSKGVCTISCSSNGPRQDWLVCPYRALNPELFASVAARLFQLDTSKSCRLIAGPDLAKKQVRLGIADALGAGDVVIVYLQSRLGGEISLSSTERSPELAFDTTMIELGRNRRGDCFAKRYAILEIQTMDFHGTYRHAVKNLKDALRLHSENFPEVLGANIRWLSEHIEGPNIANVFKRTFYQMMLKFQIASHPSCAGCALAIPSSVWDSWQKHLGKPDLEQKLDGSFVLKKPGAALTDTRAWIYVFDIAEASGNVPDPISIRQIIGTDAESIAHYALRVVPDAAVSEGASIDRLLVTIRQRLAIWWPELG
jgi:hypothetical protein